RLLMGIWIRKKDSPHGAQLKWPHRITGGFYPLGYLLYLLEILRTRRCGTGNMCLIHPLSRA
ncbi:hypothetical protein XENOCAPTIV_012212, partial [Xenoophorus captivus]